MPINQYFVVCVCEGLSLSIRCAANIIVSSRFRLRARRVQNAARAGRQSQIVSLSLPLFLSAILCLPCWLPRLLFLRVINGARAQKLPVARLANNIALSFAMKV
jgi:hypothetical protein